LEATLAGDQIKMTDDVDLLLDVMPPRIREAIKNNGRRDHLIEIVLDLGRIPESRYPEHMEPLSAEAVSREDIDYVVKRVGRFTDDNRAGIERTLHRISAMRNRVGTIVGLTCRIGRAVIGTVDILRDVIESGASILLLGRPGVGKTTLLRESARVLADDLQKRVVIVDTSNEIGGDGDIPHPGVGRARRMQVPAPDRQHAVMIEAVENHMPEVIVIDEIGTEAEALAARTIAERGVQLIATAHGNTLENLLQNPTLRDLVGGIQAVTLSDEEARRRGTQKTILERKAPPTFTVLVEIQNWDQLVVHSNLAVVVDSLLRGMPLEPELRTRTGEGKVEIRKTGTAAAPLAAAKVQAPARLAGNGILRLFTYGVSRSKLAQAIQKFRLSARVVTSLDEADLVLTLKSQKKRQTRLLRDIQKRGVPLYVIKSNTVPQLEGFLRSVFDVKTQMNREAAALQEAESGVNEVFLKDKPVELSPRDAALRKLQHQIAARYGLFSKSKGRDPFRRVIIYPA
jgi:stage III sporulation protein SpoIIIAA